MHLSPRQNLAPLCGKAVNVWPFISKSGGVCVLVQMTPGCAIAFSMCESVCVCVYEGDVVSCFLWELLCRKAALSDDSGILVADDYKK